jgi:UDP-N-acetylglucosamine transferase subunit ALG13
MILITVGTEKFPFNRLMQWIDNLIQQNFIDPEQEEIIVQYGSCTIVPNKVQGYSLLPGSEFRKLVTKARLIIAHCGEGSIDLLSTITKPFILVPRSYNFGEHVDDHQVELAEMLSKRGIPIANSLADLVNFITKPKLARITNTPSGHYSQACSLLEKQFGGQSVIEKRPSDPEIITKIKAAMLRSIHCQNQQQFSWSSALSQS